MAILPSHTPNVQKIYLPSTADLPIEEQAWIMIDMGRPTVGDLLLYEDGDNMDVRFIKWLASRAQSWSFTEANGAEVSINFDTLIRIKTVDYQYLFSKYIDSMKSVKQESGLSPEEKKLVLYFSAIKDAVKEVNKERENGNLDASISDYEFDPPPFKYTVLKYRQKMGLSPKQVEKLPTDTLFDDMDMFDIEAEFGL